MARRRRRAQARVPRRRRRVSNDLLWGLGIGVIATVVVGGFLVFSGDSGGGGCGKSLPRLSDEPLTEETFAEARQGISQVITEVSRGAIPDAESSFFISVHIFTHTLDPEIRPRNEEIAVELCESVVFLEEQFASKFGQDVTGMSLRATRIRSLIEQAQRELASNDQ